MSRPRLKHCAEQWPDCTDGEYNPSCCRFPKSCSCTIYNDDTPPDELEDAPAADATAQPCLDLEERIARLIDPEAWECADLARKWGLPVERCERYEQKSRYAARRVIDGLHLADAVTYRFHGPVRSVYGQIDPDDPDERVRQLYEEDM